MDVMRLRPAIAPRRHTGRGFAEGLALTMTRARGTPKFECMHLPCATQRAATTERGSRVETHVDSFDSFRQRLALT